MTAPIEPMVAAVAAFDLPDTGRPGGIDLPTVDLSDDEWRRLLAAVQRSRLEGALAWSLATGAWTVSSDRYAEALDAHRRAMALTLLLERELVHVVAALADKGIPVRVLKGSALARLDEPDPSRRAFGDVDLLVRGDDMAATEAVLVGRGGRRRFAEPRPGFDRRFSKGASFTFGHNSEVDVHRTLAAGPFGLTIDLEELFAHTEAIDVGGHRMFALDRRSRFIHACCHLVLGSADPRISTMRDVVRTAPGEPDEIRAVLHRAERWQVGAVIAAGIEITRSRLAWSPAVELAAWSAQRDPSARERRWLGGYVGGGRSYARQMINGLQAVSGPTGKVAYALAISLPAAAPGRTPTSERMRRGVRALRQTLP